jgi:hypothetical protein
VKTDDDDDTRERRRRSGVQFMRDDNSKSNDVPTPAEKKSGKLPSKDITPVLKGWDYESGTINVRKVNGQDGLPKLQMRLDLGLLQMEMTGRPDGTAARVRVAARVLREQARRPPPPQRTELGFHLDGDQCQSLREEAVMYYHRYLSLFVLEDFPGVVRDTARNLRVLDLCGKYAEEEQDRLVLEQYRPYITMMNARAQASILVEGGKFDDALKIVETGLSDPRVLHEVRAGGRVRAVERGAGLKRFARDIRKKIPVSPLDRLKRKLDRAVKAEHYEEAARLRDKIAGAGGEEPAGVSRQTPVALAQAEP